MAKRILTSALIAAAGEGKRLGLGPKAFVDLGGLTLLEHTVNSVSALVDEVLVGAPERCEDMAEQTLTGYPNVKVVTGGNTRLETYRNLAGKMRGKRALLRDIARPLASQKLNKQILAAAKGHVAVVACLKMDVPAVQLDNETIRNVIPREDYLIPTNPQCYARDLILELVDFETDTGHSETMWERCLLRNVGLFPIRGEKTNIKITDYEDLELAHAILLGRTTCQHKKQE